MAKRVVLSHIPLLSSLIVVVSLVEEKERRPNWMWFNFAPPSTDFTVSLDTVEHGTGLDEKH